MCRSGIRALGAALLLTVLPLPLLLLAGGCGFLGSGDSPENKPDGFPLHGYVTVAGASAGRPGSPCLASAKVPDIVAGGKVLVSDTAGNNLATGQLGSGVLAADGSAYRCNFPFQVPGVPGGQPTYVIVVGLQPAASFPAGELRADKPAVIEVAG